MRSVADPKPEPEIATCAPATPVVGDTLEMLGAAVCTVKLTPLLATPPTVTTTLPVLAPLGTVTTMMVALQKEAASALTPWKVTVLLPWLSPKLLPTRVTSPPTGPRDGDRLEMLGGTVTVKLTPLLAKPLTVTTTLPVLAPLGTVTVMPVAPQTEAAQPHRFTAVMYD